MAAPILLALLLLLLLSAGLIALGLRGRRINNHPTCRQCRFDLSGVYPAAITCPECGAGLKRDGAVRPGARRRRWVCFSAGLLLALLPILSFGALAYGLAIGANLNQYKPARLLIWESRHASGPVSLELIKELLARYNASKLSDDDIRRAVVVGLERQADAARAWQPEWGDFIEAADSDDKIDKEQFKKYINQAALLELECRPSVAQGDPIPILVKLKESRIGSASQVQATLSLDQARAGGITLRKFRGNSRLPRTEQFATMFGEADRMLGWLHLTGQNSRMGFFGARDQSAPLLLDSVYLGDSPAPLDTGPHALEVTVNIDAQPMRTGTATWSFDQRAPDAHQVTLKSQVQITAPDTGVRVVGPDPEISRQVRETLEPRHVMVNNYGQDDYYFAQVQFIPAKLPVGVAFDVLFKSPDKTWQLGTFTSGRAVGRDDDAVVFNYAGRDDSIERQVQGQLQDFNLDTVTIVLRPNIDLAKRTLDLDSVYNEELIYENVPVQWEGDRPGATPKKRRGFLERLLFGS
ncbi:MAG: hypothetical protein IT436_06325 [Phycisphaerales bacterium]|nr:hypothetical protein [Phycisphaerales bacterium]